MNGLAPASGASGKPAPPGVKPSSGVLSAATAARLAAGLWILWATTLFGGTLVSFSDPAALPRPPATVLLVSHLGSSLFLVGGAWMWFLGFSRSAAATTVALFAAGMVLGTIGDFFNGNALQDLIPLRDPVLGGIATFALGHVCYISGGLRVARRLNFRSRARFWGPIVFWQLFALVGWYLVVFRGARGAAGVLVWAALPYSMLLAGLTGLASSLALADRRFILLALGGILFLASDLILAFEMFRGTFPHA
ncbi:MAG TPA: lysoplasmalogenase family protein, partial [Planctomycetaceae bacterium]|nr:lysoplasmalogenase family protein [Planctomycetaceae bacterium]